MPEDKTEELYQQLHECMHYDAASLRALALLLNANKKNREFMKFASAELGRNARNMARAVDYFKPYFTGEDTSRWVADDYLRLFAYASLKKETAFDLFAANKFDFPLYVIRERVADAKPKRERKPTLAERIAELVREWDEIAGDEPNVFAGESDSPAMLAARNVYQSCAKAIAALPEVAKALEAKDAA